MFKSKMLKTSSQQAYGGVLVQGDQILLREPANHYDGYVWTYAKGRLDPGETPEQCALREVLEETGYEASIVGKVPGSFAGGTTDNQFFLMRPEGQPGQFHWETQSVRWVPLQEAHEWIGKTTNPTGVKRDLAVLEAVKKMLNK